MSKSVYIVNNAEQENKVLKQLIINGYEHPNTQIYKHSFVPSLNGSAFNGFPYEIIADNEAHYIYWRTIPKQMVNVSQLNKPDELIIYDGREENDKMKISKKVYDALEGWKNDLKVNGRYYIYEDDIYDLPSVIENWWKHNRGHDKEANNRLIAILRWVNGEDVFEIEKPKKWVVRSKETDSDGDHRYVAINSTNDLARALSASTESDATKFDTKEEAESWANAHQEVVEAEV